MSAAEVDVKRLGARARAQVAAALSSPETGCRRRSSATTAGDSGVYRCAACGNVESGPDPTGRRRNAYTRAQAHADEFKHHRIEIVTG